MVEPANNPQGTMALTKLGTLAERFVRELSGFLGRVDMADLPRMMAGTARRSVQ
jgi:hypothetical protein